MQKIALLSLYQLKVNSKSWKENNYVENNIFKTYEKKRVDMYMKDITFCINKECKERKDCFRAEENYTNTNSVNSYAMFDCNSCGERAYLYEKVDTNKK